MAGGRIEGIERISPDRPDQTAGDDGRTVGTTRGLPQSGGCRPRGGSDRPQPVRTGHEQGSVEVGGSTVGIVSAEVRRRVQLSTDVPEVRLSEGIGGEGLAHLEDQSVGEEGRCRRSEVEVGPVVGVPLGRGKVVEQLHGRTQFEHTVAVVVRVARRAEGAVSGGYPHIALGVNGWSRAAHPHRPLAVSWKVGHHEGGRRRAVLGRGHHQSVVVAAVTGVTTESDDDATPIEGQ